jgi:hypothetical protein
MEQEGGLYYKVEDKVKLKELEDKVMLKEKGEMVMLKVIQYDNLDLLR